MTTDAVTPQDSAGRSPLPIVEFVVPATLPDTIRLPDPCAVSLMGYLGARVHLNDLYLAQVDLEPRLAGFRRRPGIHPWIGEHIGKWLHAASLTWHRTGDADLRRRMDYAVNALLATQEDDGYLGTYAADRRFGQHPGADWDVWVHKYNLIGLLSYYRHTGEHGALAASIRAADLLVATFGDGPGQRDIVSAGTHVGMAATSVLEPMVLLYRLSGEDRYLDFARYLVRAWDGPEGPRILSGLRQTGQVSRVANGKAYEMLSNLIGLCELARATGDQWYLATVLTAWRDIADNHLYVTGTASYREHFHRPHELPNDAASSVGETCVTVTWLQLTEQLLRLTGEARYADEIERTAYNHLLAAQRPDGLQWCYYTALEGIKPFSPGISCCVSSGPRGVALLPTLEFGTSLSGDLVVSLLDEGSATLHLGDASVRIDLEPATGDDAVVLRLNADRRVDTRLLIRAPSWAQGFRVRERPGATVNGSGWVVVAPVVLDEEFVLHLDFERSLMTIAGVHSNAGRIAIADGPFILAHEPLANAASYPGRLVPFADAGSNGHRYRVWIPIDQEGASDPT